MPQIALRRVDVLVDMNGYTQVPPHPDPRSPDRAPMTALRCPRALRITGGVRVIGSDRIHPSRTARSESCLSVLLRRPQQRIASCDRVAAAAWPSRIMEGVMGYLRSGIVEGCCSGPPLLLGRPGSWKAGLG